MNDQDREELRRLKERQELLRSQLDQLDAHVRRFDERLATAAPPPLPVPKIKPLDITPLAMEERAVPPPLPPVIAQPVVEQILAARDNTSASEREARLHAWIEQGQPWDKTGGFAEPPPVMPAAATPVVPQPAAPAAKENSFEMRLGTYWLVRIGIVMLLTGLVFLGGYAYKNYIGRLGAPGKVGLLYAAGGLLLGAGAWLQRKSVKPALQNYGQVLFAGGLAAVYFTTFAAHHFDNLRIIQSALLDGLLLLGWATVIVFLADWRKSQVLALFAIGLAYYTSVITDVGLFTLYSNLILTAAAVFFLIRNRWTTLSLVSLVATYGGFAFWRFHQGWDAHAGELLRANLFLGGYWILFTAGVFLSRAQTTPRGARAAFLSANNAGFFALVVLSMLHVHHGHFWQFSLGFGAVLLALAASARRLFPEEISVKNSYLTQGLLLVTVGFIAYFTGLKLALVLAAESVVLLVLGGQLRSSFLRAGSVVVGAVAVAWGTFTLGWGALTMRDPGADLIMGLGVGALLAFNAFWSQRRESQIPTFVPASSAFLLFAVGMWFVTSLHQSPPVWFDPALVLAAESVALVVLGGLWRSSFLRGVALLIGALAAVSGAVKMQSPGADLIMGIGGGVLLAFNAFWSARTTEAPNASLLRPFTTAFVLCALGFWFATTLHEATPIWIAPAFALEALVLTAVGRGLRHRELALGAQVFLLTAQSVWLLQTATTLPRPPWWSPALVIAVTLALGHWWQRQRAIALPRTAGQGLQILAALAVVGVLLFWLHPFFGGGSWLVMTSLLAVAVTAYGVATRFWILAITGQLALVVSGYKFVNRIAQTAPPWHYALAPMVALLALATATTIWLARKPAEPQLNSQLIQAAGLYRWMALAMSLAWVCEYVPKEHLVWTFTALGLALFALAGLRPNLEARLASGVYLAAGLVAFVTRLALEPGLPNLADAAVLIALAAMQAVARRQPARWPLPEVVHTVMILAAGLGTWAFVWRWVVLKSGGTHFYLTASWAVLALGVFAAGFALRERMYRWLGLGILAASVARVFFSDVWKLDLLYRILSFMALGIVLLVLGFIYTKYQEKIKEWL